MCVTCGGGGGGGGGGKYYTMLQINCLFLPVSAILGVQLPTLSSPPSRRLPAPFTLGFLPPCPPLTCTNNLLLKPPLCFYLFLGAFPDAFKFQENLKKLREMIQEPTLRELLKTCINPDVGCSNVFKAVVRSFITNETHSITAEPPQMATALG